MRKHFMTGIIILGLLTGSSMLTACSAETGKSADVQTTGDTEAAQFSAERAQTEQSSAETDPTAETAQTEQSSVLQTADSADTAVDSAGAYSSFETTDLAGNVITADVFADYKLTMINVWATYCGPCLKEMPELGELSREYQDKGLQIIGIPIDTLEQDGTWSKSQVANAASLASQTGADYLHILPSQDLINAGLSDIYAVPTTFFADSTGHVIGETYMGSKSKEDWEKIIDQTLQNMK